MAKQIEEISSMLDKVVGGKKLFNIDITLFDTERCTTICNNICEGAVGSVSGSKCGSITKEPFTEKK